VRHFSDRLPTHHHLTIVVAEVTVKHSTLISAKVHSNNAEYKAIDKIWTSNSQFYPRKTPFSTSVSRSSLSLSWYSFVAQSLAHAYVKITNRMTAIRQNAWLRPSGLAEPVRVGDPWSSGLCDRSFADYLITCMTPTTVSAEKGRRRDVNLTLLWTRMQSLPESDASVSQRWTLWPSREFGTSVSLRKGIKRLFEIGERSKVVYIRG
jgi:hypothetical protein